QETFQCLEAFLGRGHAKFAQEQTQPVILCPLADTRKTRCEMIGRVAILGGSGVVTVGVLMNFNRDTLEWIINIGKGACIRNTIGLVKPTVQSVPTTAPDNHQMGGA